MDTNEAETPPATADEPVDAPDDVCEACGATIDTNDWYPIAKERGADGSLGLYPFCSDDCKDQWQHDRTES